jgi:hypothetical protein
MIIISCALEVLVHVRPIGPGGGVDEVVCLELLHVLCVLPWSAAVGPYHRLTWKSEECDARCSLDLRDAH